MIEKVKEATTPDEIRSEIFRLRRNDPMVRAVMDMADYKGMSAEDRYAVLAYYALRERAVLKQTVLDDALMRPMPPIILTPKA